MASLKDNRRGIFGMLTAMALFSINDTLLKLASSALAPGQVMAARGIVACGLALVLVAFLGKLTYIPALARGRVVVRALLETLVAFTFITALARLPLAIITAILLATPLILTLLAVVMGIERVGWRRWTSIVVGFVGVLLIVRPTLEGVDGSVLLALACAALVAVRDLMTRSIPQDVPSVIVTFATTIGVTVGGFLLVLGEGGLAGWRPIPGSEWLILAAAALAVTTGNIAVVAAFRGTDVSVVSPFRYSVIIWAIVAGWLVFGYLPDLLTVVGIALIVASGLYTIHRERVRGRREAALADAPVASRPAA